MQDLETDTSAHTNVDAKRKFSVHLSVYLAVNALLIAINSANTSEHLWFIWPLFGWGIGVAFHAIGVFCLTRGN